MDSFEWAIWKHVYHDAKCGLWDWWRVLKETGVALAVGWIIYSETGNPDARMDFAIEKLLVIPATLVVLMLIHGIWSWGFAPRKIYYEQGSRIAELVKLEANALAAAANERLGIVRGHLHAHIANSNNVTDQDEMTAWIVGAEEMVRGMVPSMLTTLQRAWPQQHHESPDLSPQDMIALEKAVSSLKVIAGRVKVSDLP